MKIFGPDEEEIPPPPPIPEEDIEESVEEEAQEEPAEEEKAAELEAQKEEAVQEPEEETPAVPEKKKFSVSIPKISIPGIIKKEKLPDKEKKPAEEVIPVKPEDIPVQEVNEMRSQGLDKEKIASDLRSKGYDNNAISDAVFEAQVNEIAPAETPAAEIQEQEEPEELPAFPKMEEKIEVQELKPVEEEAGSEFPKPVEPIIKKDTDGAKPVSRGLFQKVFGKKEPISAEELVKRQEQMLKELEKAVQKTAV